MVFVCFCCFSEKIVQGLDLLSSWLPLYSCMFFVIVVGVSGFFDQVHSCKGFSKLLFLFDIHVSEEISWDCGWATEEKSLG